jgi:hypothetical protein
VTEPPITEGRTVQVPRTEVLVRVRFRGIEYATRVDFDEIALDRAVVPDSIVRHALRRATEEIELKILTDANKNRITRMELPRG